MNEITQGDKVVNIHTEEIGEVINTYPEVNTAIVKTAYGTTKVKYEDLIVLKNVSDSEAETKKQSLLNKIKGKFSGRYD